MVNTVHRSEFPRTSSESRAGGVKCTRTCAGVGYGEAAKITRGCTPPRTTVRDGGVVERVWTGALRDIS